MRRYLLLYLLLCLYGLARGQTDGYSSYYWFDFQQGKPQTSPVVQGSFDVDVATLADGLHAFHYVVAMQDGGISSPITSYFMKGSQDDVTVKGYYWFDDETEVRDAMVTNGTFEVDASSLSDGFHRFYYQALQANGVTSTPSISYFLKAAQVDSDGELTCICTVDGQLCHTEALPHEGGVIHWNLDMQDLAEGLHQLQIDALTADGAMSDSQHSFFVKVPEADTSIKGYYWFDDETAVREAIVTNGTFEVDASSLSDGFHKFYYLALQANGVSSLPSTSYFLKTAQVNPEGELTCICTVDGQLRHTEKLSQQGGAIHWNLDMQDLADGIHQIQLQAVTSGGALSSSYASYFMRVINEGDMSKMSCVYTIDGNPLSSKSHVVSHDGSYHFDLNLSELEEGLHYISYMLHGDKGTSATPQIRFFVKVPLGGNGIDQYQYWLNDDEASQATTVTLPQKVNPLQLMSLLPVESRPLRSSQFHFDVSGSKPMIYAKNTIHLRFYDVAKWYSDIAKEYADYSKSREVEPVGELQATQTFSKIEENDIRWYTMHSAPGDTVAFKLSQPATIQLFTPSGAEVFKTSESASVNWDGIHVWEDGTYYLAVHDVTGSKEEMTLEYMHMDKYDVVDWDVRTVGNGGCSTITFKGNGFRDLYAVDLVVAPGDTIHSAAICHISDANAAVTFDFSDAELGEYNAVFHFTEEDKDVSDVVTVKEAKEIELALDVKYPSSYLRGTSTTFTISVTNNGNATAYDIPMEIYLSAEDSFKNIQSIKIKDESGKILNDLSLDGIDKDSIDNETLAYYEELLRQMNGQQSFVIWKDSIRSEEYGFSDMLLTVPANSTSTLYLEIMSNTTVSLYVKIPTTWLTIYSKDKVNETRKRQSNIFNRDWCCEKGKWQCLSGVISGIVGVIPVAACVPSAVDYLFVNDVFEIACTDGTSIGNKIESFYLSVALDKEKNKSHFNRGISSLVGCVSGAILKSIAALAKKLKSLRKAQAAALTKHKNYYDSFIEKQNLANSYKKEAEKAFQEGKYEVWNSLMEKYDQYMSEAGKLENLSSVAWDEYKKILCIILEDERSIDELKKGIERLFNFIKGGIDTFTGIPRCRQIWKKTNEECSPAHSGGGSSTPQPPSDPNDIYGYLSQAGSKFIADSVARVNYTIEFENDTTFAEAAAHTIVIKDTLDSRYFDLTKFMPTGVRIGSREAFLNEADVVNKNDKASFVKTIDMRPEINAIAQVNGEYNQKNGIAQWTFQSLDPMTMEPTNDLMQGILPVNYDGTSGIGEVMFEIGVKQGKADGTEIKNRAGIVFDYEEAILTPTWTNIVDAVAPSSVINDSWMLNDSTLRVTADGFDARSGVWKYEWYVQAGENAPWWKEGETESASFDYHIYEGIDYGFCVLAVDSAGNVEQKVIQRERGFKTYGQDYEDNISPLIVSPEEGQVYDLSGRRHDEPQEGINIIDKKKVLFRRKK